MNKEKTIVFNKWRKVEALTGTVTKDAMRTKLIEECLSRGYVPAHFGYEVGIFDNWVNKIDRMSCLCAYAGKKMARIIYEKSHEQLEKFNFKDLIANDK